MNKKKSIIILLIILFLYFLPKLGVGIFFQDSWGGD